MLLACLIGILCIIHISIVIIGCFVNNNKIRYYIGISSIVSGGLLALLYGIISQFIAAFLWLLVAIIWFSTTRKIKINMKKMP